MFRSVQPIPLATLVSLRFRHCEEMVEVFVVTQRKQSLARDVVVAVCASRERAERYVATESRDGREFKVVAEPLLS